MSIRRLLLCLFFVCLAACSTGSTSQLPSVSRTDSISLVSPAFGAGSNIPTKYTCDGQDVSPPLSWSGGPPADEYALVLIDPDAPGGEFVHWVVYGVPGSANAFPEGGVPAGSVEGTNGFHQKGYRGPCPPSGDAAHRYVFTLYGLRVAKGSSLPQGAPLDEVLAAVRCCIQSKGTLAGLYGR
jgi:Raf kinase inhibitor-like YbhB/YbcL family protein